MTARGAALVARQEIRTRLRTGRWRVLLAVWFAVVNGLALLFRLALEADSTSRYGSPGVPMFGGVLLAVLVLTLLITPALSAQSINGDRERGTLATLQVTPLAPGDIAFGKLAASWGTGLVVLLLTVPSLLWPVAEGAIGPMRAVAVLLVTALLIGVVCAVSQGWSALLARSITSVLLSYLTVFALIVGTPLLFTIAVPITSEQGVDGYDNDRTDRIWWLLAPNPVVILADAAPSLPKRRIIIDEGAGSGGHRVDYYEAPPNDPLGSISRGVRRLRLDDGHYRPSYAERSDGPPVWPFGLAFDLVLGAGAVWVSASRLRTPLYRVPKGVRIA
ncbi:ABC transporter permease [Actinomadura litoris]|uniref:ABC transporter permease n=1 Tax=Actinomadura litoris TaxID=2678616 RepID=A0A7K1L803_9ACTN|nr:ABC transporter permease [Actinomadura litoris]MUN40574.1 ABC transporter permease [Actinomadura litoris]